MFDLFNSQKAKKYVMGGILVLVSASMLFYLGTNYNTGGPNDTVLAKIGNARSPSRRPAGRSSADARQADPRGNHPQLRTHHGRGDDYRPGMAYEAQKLGMQVTDQEMADYMRKYPNLFQDGKFIGKDYYAAMLAQQGTSIGEFEADLKRRMLVGRLREVAIEGAVVSEAEIEEAYHKKNDQIQLEYVKLSQDKFKKEAEPTEAEMQQYFKTNAARYKIPRREPDSSGGRRRQDRESAIPRTGPDGDVQPESGQFPRGRARPRAPHPAHDAGKSAPKPPRSRPRRKTW